MKLQTPTRRHFTGAARVAAAEARRRKREEASPFGTPEVYAIRHANAHLGFCWEIRRFGGVVIERGMAAHTTPGAARSAGLRVLSDELVSA